MFRKGVLEALNTAHGGCVILLWTSKQLLNDNSHYLTVYHLVRRHWNLKTKPWCKHELAMPLWTWFVWLHSWHSSSCLNISQESQIIGGHTQIRACCFFCLCFKEALNFRHIWPVHLRAFNHQAQDILELEHSSFWKCILTIFKEGNVERLVSQPWVFCHLSMPLEFNDSKWIV